MVQTYWLSSPDLVVWCAGSRGTSWGGMEGIAQLASYVPPLSERTILRSSPAFLLCQGLALLSPGSGVCLR